MTSRGSTGAIVIHPLTPDRAPDFMAFFEGDAFADNPTWAACYCAFCHFDHAKGGWSLPDAVRNKAASAARIVAGQMKGHLAYADGGPIGWVNTAPSVLYPAGNLPDDGDDRSRVGQVLCFVVAPAWRKRGVARALLAAACAGLKAQGMTIAEANPRDGATGDAENHFGPLALYLDAGFKEHARDEADGSIYVRKSL